MTFARRDRLWLAVAALTLIGLALRMIAARGALWLDEAWSATFAQEAATPIGVIWQINHDNNHILNTLWLQLMGPNAHPLAQRALSIVTGTLAIPLAASIAARRGDAAALTAALAFAISPALLNYGSEARGYAPMMAAFLAMLTLIDRGLDDAERPAPPATLAILALLGMLAQVMMIVPLLAMTGWMGVLLWRRYGFASALRMTVATLGPALAVSASVLLVMTLAALAAPHGFTIGSYSPFRLAQWSTGIADATAWTTGIAADDSWPAMFGLFVATLMLIVRWQDRRTLFYAVLILAFPLSFALLRVGNAATPRFYLATMIALLLLTADTLGALLAGGRASRIAAAAAIALFVTGAARLDLKLIAGRRADPGAAITAMRAMAPRGTTVMLPDDRLEPVYRLAARAAGYPLRIVRTSCTPTPMLILDSDHPAVGATLLRLCSGTYRLFLKRRAEGLSGTNWWLYRRIAA